VADIKYVITVDSTGATTKIQDFDKVIADLEKTSGKTKGAAASFGSQLMTGLVPSFTVASLAADGIKKTLGFLEHQFVSTFTAAIEAERVDRALNASLEITGRIVPGLAEDLSAYALKLQTMTVYDDEAIASVETLLIQMTHLDEAGIQKATRGAIGLASVMGIDLNSAAMLVQKAMEGNYGALGRYGIKVDETLPKQEQQAQLLERLDKMFQRATSETGTAAGSLAQMNNTIEQSKEKIGSAFLPAISLGAQLVGNLVSKITGLNSELEKLDGKAKKQAATNELYADTFFLITARAGRTQEYVTNLAKLYGYNYEAIIGMIEAGRYGEQLEGEWNKERDKTLAKVKALTDSWVANEKGTVKSNEGSAAAAAKLRKALQELVDQADPIKTKYQGVIENMILVEGAFKTGAISGSNYRKVMDWLQESLRDVDKQAAKLGTTVLPKINREIVKLMSDPKFAPKATPWGTTWIEDMQAFGKKTSETMSSVQMVATQVFGQLDAIAAQSQKNKEIALDNEYQTRLETIKATITNEEDQRKAIEGLDAEYDIKRRSLQHAAAKQQKAASLAQAIINVAEGISKALAQGGIFGPILAAAVAAMGAVQIKLITQQPIPFREGNLFTRATTLYTPSGRQVNVAEAEPEILAPEAKLRKIMREEIRRAGGAGQSQAAAIYLDGKRVGQALMPAFGKLSKRGRGGTSVRTLTRSET